MIVTSTNFADNNQKRYARDFLVSTVNDHFKSVPRALTMLELLGTGVGAEYYSNNIKHLGRIDCVEMSKKLFNGYDVSNDKINLFHDNLDHYLQTCKSKKYDILNLDFCAYFCEEKMKTRESTGHLLKEVFNTRKFKIGTLIFVTFLLKGYHVNISQYKDKILTSPENIINRICDIASEFNVKLESLDEIFLYKPTDSAWNTMMHTGFVVNEM